MVEKLFEEIVAIMSLDLMKSTNQHTEGAQQTPSRIDLKDCTLRHIKVNLSEDKDRQNLKSSKRKDSSHKENLKGYSRDQGSEYPKKDKHRRGVLWYRLGCTLTGGPYALICSRGELC